jgi:PAS domain S-box-containing protein
MNNNPGNSNYLDTAGQRPLPPKEKKVNFSTTSEIYNAVYENAFHPMYIGDGNGHILRSNEKLSKMLGYSQKELAAKETFEIFDINESAFLDFLSERNTEGIAKAEVTCISKSFDKLPCRISSVIYKTDNGERRSLNTIVDLSQYVSYRQNMSYMGS